MKKIVLIAGILAVLTILLQSCSKTKVERATINVALKQNQSYRYDLGGFGDEEGAGISKQASHYLVSKTFYDTTGLANIFYTYTPAFNYVGIDEVELKSSKGSNGSGYNPRVTYTTLKFTISN